MSEDERAEILAELRQLRSEYVGVLNQAQSEERRVELKRLLDQIDECIRIEASSL